MSNAETMQELWKIGYNTEYTHNGGDAAVAAAPQSKTTAILYDKKNAKTSQNWGQENITKTLLITATFSSIW